MPAILAPVAGCDQSVAKHMDYAIQYDMHGLFLRMELNLDR
jgi:hypothetical protein